MDEATAARPTSDGARALTGALVDDNELHDLLQRLTLLARHTVRHSQSVSITVVEDGRYRTSNSTGPEPLALDEAQYGEGDGPCLEAIRSRRQLAVTVEERPDRWPRFHDEARHAGVTGTLSTPLVRCPDDVVGALNIYAGEDGGFSAGDRRTADLLGEIVATLVGRSLALRSSSQLNEQLRQAVATREIIGEAKGILMVSQSCTRDEAFDILRRASQRENRKLRELAEELVLRVEARAERKVAGR